MPTEFAFRVSTYLSLALACVCLGYAEWELLPEVTGFMAAVLALLAVSFRYEGRIELSLARANVLGLAIGVLGVMWMAVKMATPPTGLMANLTWPTTILPYAGPLLLVLIPAKLFRPKHVGDWWAMQGVGLAAVGLAAAMSDDELFVALLCLYLFFAVLSLTLFYYRRSGGHVAPLPAADPLAPPAPRPAVVFSQANVNPDAPPPYRFAVGRSLRWIALAAVLAAPLFLVTPRDGLPSWGLARPKMEVGLSTGDGADMSRTGELQASREEAYRVTVRGADGQPMELAGEPYWRWRGYPTYDGAKWVPATAGLSQLVFLSDDRLNPRGGPAADAWRAAGREPFAVELTPTRGDFRPPDPGPVPVALAPVAWVSGRESPVISATAHGELPWLLYGDGNLGAGTGFGQRYRQSAVLPVEPGLGPPMTPRLPPADPPPGVPTELDRWLMALTRGAPEGVRKLADTLVREWVDAGRLPPDTLTDRRPGQLRVAAARREAVAAAFAEYLGSADFVYTTRLRRANKATDPIEDFLLHGKQGHCVWFAAAHALLLRSVGVPCQFVRGYRGCEPQGDGNYLILQEQAHAWVEVLVERPAGDRTALHWRIVDPTPGGDVPAMAERGWWATAKQKGADFVADYILGYNPEKQRQALGAAKSFAATWWPALPPLVALAVAWRTRRRWWPARPAARPHPLITSATPPWFLDYLNATAGLGLIPPTGQTPREFAEVAAAALRASPAGSEVAEVPAFVTSKFYRVRYAGAALTAGEEAEVRAAVARLLAAVEGLSALRPPAG